MPSRTRALALVAAAVSILALAGCQGKASKTPSASASASPTQTATSTAPSPSAPSPSAPSPRSAGPLLSADEVPPLDNVAQWLAVSTSSTEPRQFGTCQRFGILAIGAERVVVRRFRPADIGESPNLASELVATFPDEMTARRAYSVLESWHKKCAGLLRRYTNPQVGAIRSVSVGDAQAGWYLLTYGPVAGQPGKVFLDAQGMAIVGKRIAMVSLIRVGKKGDSPPPMPEALKVAASRL